MMTINETDVENSLRNRVGNRRFADTLQTVPGGADLLRLLTRYLHFNATFGAGVANLAGRIGVRQDLFRDADEPVAVLADRSMDVAADIFAAAIDEFGGTAIPRHTHRAMALATLKATAAYFGCDAAALNAAATINPATEAAVDAAQRGYGIGDYAPDESALLRGIGFHIGSEILADEEFRLLDGALRARFPALVAQLETATVEINGLRHPAYVWIHLHTSVEADHFAAAVAGANRALRFYTGTRPLEAVRDEILAGIGAFADVQTALMTGLTEDSTVNAAEKERNDAH